MYNVFYINYVMNLIRKIILLNKNGKIKIKRLNELNKDYKSIRILFNI